MGRPEPILGYASKEQACVELRARGFKIAEIAEKLEMAVGTVGSHLSNSKNRHRIGVLKPHLREEHLKWLEANVPPEMSYAEYIVEALLDEAIYEASDGR